MHAHTDPPTPCKSSPLLPPGVARRRRLRSRSWCVRVGLAPAISLAVASCRNNWRERQRERERVRERERERGERERELNRLANTPCSLGGLILPSEVDTSLPLSLATVSLSFIFPLFPIALCSSSLCLSLSQP